MDIEEKRLKSILRGITDPALIAKKIKDHKKLKYKDNQGMQNDYEMEKND